MAGRIMPAPDAATATTPPIAARRDFLKRGASLSASLATGAALAGLKEFGEAEHLLLSGYEGLRDLRDAPAAHLRTAMERLVDFYLACGRPEQAVAWRNRLNGVTAAAPSAATSARR